jgi:phospholipase D1/2
MSGDIGCNGLRSCMSEKNRHSALRPEQNARPLLQPGRNCWRLGRSARVAFLIDGQEYFRAVAAALRQARQSVLILGWDIDSRIRLEREGAEGGEPLGDFLNRLVTQRRDLHIHILDWDYVMLYAFEREPLPALTFGWRTHRRVHFVLDDQHPFGASHHQKVVVVDDRIAFVGGFDLAACRWDTSEHLPNDARRWDNGTHYSPFHDVQMLVDGESAAALGELARQRWRRATGQRLAPPTGEIGDPWPRQVPVAVHDVDVAVARTEPPAHGQPGIFEVQALYLDAITAARDWLYLESQYLTSAVIGQALAARLSGRDAPEVVLVLPREATGWMEQSTMGVLREPLLRRLREADRFGRLRIYYPHLPTLGPEFINIHSKVLVVDDNLLRIGSANLTNRSMGIDTECDLAMEARGDAEVERAIRTFRHRLLAEHLGTTIEQVDRVQAQQGSLIRTIESLRNEQRSLEPIAERNNWLEQVVPEIAPIDPLQPSVIEDYMGKLVSEKEQETTATAAWRWRIFLLWLVAALLLAGVWRWTDLSEILNLRNLGETAAQFRHSPLAPLFVMGAFIIGGLVMFPVTLMILATALAFEPLAGFSYALGGSLASALLTYVLGRWLGREKVRQLAGGRLQKLNRQLARQGLLAMVAIRYLPVAPFTVVNLVAGASQIRMLDFFLGTMLGMAPGILLINLFENTLSRAARDPQAGHLVLVGLFSVVLLAGIWALRRWLAKRG